MTTSRTVPNVVRETLGNARNTNPSWTVRPASGPDPSGATITDQSPIAGTIVTDLTIIVSLQLPAGVR